MVRAIRWELFRLDAIQCARSFGPIPGLIVIGVGSRIFGPNWVTLALGFVTAFVVPIWILRRSQRGH